MMYLRLPLLLTKLDELHHARGIEVSHEMVRFWWSGSGSTFVSKIRRKRMSDILAPGGAGTVSRCS
jgi:putative transposase